MRGVADAVGLDAAARDVVVVGAGMAGPAAWHGAAEQVLGML